MGNNLLSAALNYAEKFNLSVIPIKPDKKPFLPWTEFQTRRASSEEIKKWWGQWPSAMVGICTGEVSGIFVVDCDTQEGYEAVQKLLPESLLMPTARTPRGGWHLYFRWMEDYKLTVGAGVLPGVDFRGQGGYIIAPPSTNAEGKAYAWQDGLPLDVELPSMPGALSSALNNNKVHYRGGVDSSVDSDDFFTVGRRDEDLFSIANALVRGNLPEKIIKQALDIIASNCKPPFPSSEAEEKIRSAMVRAERRDRTLSTDVREWVLSTSGTFLSTDVYQCLQLSTRDEKKNVSIILKRMCDEGEIERSGNKNGQFRRLDNEIEPLDWKNADISPLPLRWPFGIEHLVSVYPGNIAVIAGAPNAGKTSFILNFIKLNQQNHAVHLFSSEGGPEELNMRISKFDLPLSDWTFKAWDRSGDFADVIRPDAINVVDYLELHDDFFKVGGMLKAISDRLKNGFCLIALQKNSGRDEGLGGARGLEKPRLYLAMDNGRLKIVKGKSWANRVNNPNGQSINFKLADGCKFITESKWTRES
ncbi:MAG: bifunctional DNA primase/polymerase [Deltaproteobacteria bacterium]|nr:bifunctional DNA primase/polymerase [Deltaproteobacteria bacterium]